MTLQKKMLKKVPKEHQFEYLLAWKRLMMIRESLKGYVPVTEEDEEWVGRVLKDYRKNFLKIASINELMI